MTAIVGRPVLVAGAVIAAVVLSLPLARFVFAYLPTLVHELGHAATGWGATRNPGYHSRHVASQSPFKTRLRICSSRWARYGWSCSFPATRGLFQRVDQQEPSDV